VNVWTCLDVVVYGSGLLSGRGVAPDPVCRLLERRSALKAATKPTPRITTAIEAGCVSHADGHHNFGHPCYLDGFLPIPDEPVTFMTCYYNESNGLALA